MDLLPSNIQSRWYLLPENVRSILGWPHLDLGDIYTCFNIQDVSDIQLPKNIDKVLLTYHTEYIKHADLLDFFLLHQDTQFLFLTDWAYSEAQFAWPQNVTCIRWLTWHHQLDHIMQEHGVNSQVRRPLHKISSLSFRHEFHKAAITAYLLKTFCHDDMVLSWWDERSENRLFYLAQDYYLPKNIADIVLHRDFQNRPAIRLDNFTNSPISNSNWRHPAYLDCLFNCSNESVYNDFCIIDGNIFSLPRPYLTEKTWKPLLAGRPIVPVAQQGALSALEDLGFQFIPEISQADRVNTEFDRIVMIWRILDWINSKDLSLLFDYSYDSVCHNLSHIVNGGFSACCDKHNCDVMRAIESWAQ